MSHIVKPAGDIRYQDRFYYNGKLYACCFLLMFFICVCVYFFPCIFAFWCVLYIYIGIRRTVPALGKSSHLARSVSPVGRTTRDNDLCNIYAMLYLHYMLYDKKSNLIPQSSLYECHYKL